MCIFTLLCIIPVAGALAALATVVCWIVYWVRLNGYSRLLKSRAYHPPADAKW